MTAPSQHDADDGANAVQGRSVEHQPVEPYPKVFWIVFLASLAYLVLILAMGAAGGHAPAHH